MRTGSFNRCELQILPAGRCFDLKWQDGPIVGTAKIRADRGQIRAFGMVLSAYTPNRRCGLAFARHNLRGSDPLFPAQCVILLHFPLMPNPIHQPRETIACMKPVLSGECQPGCLTTPGPDRGLEIPDALVAWRWKFHEEEEGCFSKIFPESFCQMIAARHAQPFECVDSQPTRPFLTHEAPRLARAIAAQFHALMQGTPSCGVPTHLARCLPPAPAISAT